mmetsp:Transcript_18176/g.43505  ORF Transcript_18176/g.43505 Transcript_18176/m.43505 type:complete len:97 (+) Transcript_18176:247-537(+)
MISVQQPVLATPVNVVTKNIGVTFEYAYKIFFNIARVTVAVVVMQNAVLTTTIPIFWMVRDRTCGNAHLVLFHEAFITVAVIPVGMTMFTALRCDF